MYCNIKPKKREKRKKTILTKKILIQSNSLNFDSMRLFDLKKLILITGIGGTYALKFKGNGLKKKTINNRYIRDVDILVGKGKNESI